MAKKFKLLLAVMLIGTVGIVPTQVGAVEQELKIQNDDFELYGVDATTSATLFIGYSKYFSNPVEKIWQTKYKNGITYSGYVYFKKIINDNGTKYALYKGKLYGHVAPPFRTLIDEEE